MRAFLSPLLLRTVEREGGIIFGRPPRQVESTLALAQVIRLENKSYSRNIFRAEKASDAPKTAMERPKPAERKKKWKIWIRLPEQPQTIVPLKSNDAALFARQFVPPGRICFLPGPFNFSVL